MKPIELNKVGAATKRKSINICMLRRRKPLILAIRRGFSGEGVYL